MKHRQDNNAIFLRTKIRAVRKTVGDDTPNIFANNGKLKKGAQMPATRNDQFQP